MPTSSSRRITAVALVLMAAGAAACSGDSPTRATLTPSTPHFDGGATFGSGNFVDTTTSQNTTAVDTGSAARGGATFGSGN